MPVVSEYPISGYTTDMTVTLVKNIPLSEQTVKRLQRLAVPLEDSYDSVISKILDFYEKNHEPSKMSEAETGAPISKQAVKARLQQYAKQTGDRSILQLLDTLDAPLERTFDPFIPPNLTHTKVTAALINGQPPVSLSWNGLLDEAVRIARSKLRSFPEIRKLSQMNIVEGRKSDEGYHFLEDVGLSVQGQDANDAWRCTAYVARHLGFAVDVSFLWRAKEGAAYPGSNGRFALEGRS
jgi:hypothetical protein